MPGHDGTGPEGTGPLTGKCAGSCTLVIPDDLTKPIQGFTGQRGRPVSFGVNPERRKEDFDMPGGNRTGPAGAGPLTGRGRGLCKGFDAPDAVNRPRGGGQGRRRWTPGAGPSQKQPLGGFGAGYGPRESSASDQLEVLKAQAGYLEKSLDGIKRRIKELETAGDQ